jgi:hypothetical protein
MHCLKLNILFSWVIVFTQIIQKVSFIFMLTGVLVCKKVINTFSFVRAHFLSTSIDYDGAPFLNAYINLLSSHWFLTSSNAGSTSINSLLHGVKSV